MEVSDREKNIKLVERDGQAGDALVSQDPVGEELIGAVVSLTGLPEPLVPLMNEEMGQILDRSGQTPGSVTLESLREAMLIYLQSIAESMSSSEEGHPASNLPASNLKEGLDDPSGTRIGAERLTLVTK